MSKLISDYGAVCKLIARLYPGQVEVVLHDLRRGTIAVIEGNISKRAVGDESLVESGTLDADADAADIIGPYSQTNWDGETLRSFTAVLRDEEGRPSGLICVNMRTAAFSAAADLLAAFTTTDPAPRSNALFVQDWREAANGIISDVLSQRGVTLVTARRDDKVALVAALDQAGILEMRGSPDYAAKTLGMSRASIYNLLKDARRAEAPGDNVKPVDSGKTPEVV